MRIITHTVEQEDEGRTFRSILTLRLCCSTAFIKKLKRRDGSVTVNGVPLPRLNLCAKSGDVLAFDVGDAEREEPRGSCPFPVAYEDEDLLIIDKPASAAVHASGGTAADGTVAHELERYLGGGVHIVNRLDRGTSGLMAVAKNAYTHELMRRTLHGEGFYREYLAIVHAGQDPGAGFVDLPIARAQESVIKRETNPQGAPARTDYETLAFGGGFALLKVVPRTGRTHQIRVHLAAAGMPLAGDWLYGREEREIIPRPALHSYRITVKNPVTLARADVCVSPPGDMAKIIGRIKGEKTN